MNRLYEEFKKLVISLMHKEGIVTFINGPVVKAENMSFKVREMVTIGKQRLMGK